MSIYTYDNLYRLAQTDNPDFEDEAFTYDGVGNRLTSQGVTGDWSYNKNNELLAYAENSFEYDPNGNMTQKTESNKNTQFFYNTEDRLEIVEDASGNLVGTYYYDPFGQRLWKEEDRKRTYFFYTDEGLNTEFNENGDEIKAYGFKPNSIWTADPLFMKVGPEYYFYHNDHLGTPYKITTVNGSLIWNAQYESFGKTIVDNNIFLENNLRFPGQYQVNKTDLHYNFHRYYDFTTGRYLTPDPIGIDGGVNLFAYAQFNPIYFIDPTGLEGSPGIGDQINPFGFRGDGVKNYKDYFDKRFPKTISGAKALLKQRIVKKICANIGKNTMPGLTGGADDIDIFSNMQRFGDPPQKWYERNVRIGNFQIKTDSIKIKWNGPDCLCFFFNTIMLEFSKNMC